MTWPKNRTKSFRYLISALPFIRTFPKYQERLTFVVPQTAHGPMLYLFAIQVSIIPAFSSFLLRPNRFPQLLQWANWQSEGSGGFTKPGTANRTTKGLRASDTTSPSLKPSLSSVEVFWSGVAAVVVVIGRHSLFNPTRMLRLGDNVGVFNV